MRNVIFTFALIITAQVSYAQTYAEMTGKSYAEWKDTYSFNLANVCPDVQKRTNDPSLQQSLILENTLAITRARVVISERFVSKGYQEKFNKIVEARKKAIGSGTDATQIDPNKYMKKFNFHGYCVCRNDVSKFVPNEAAYKAVPLEDMQQIEDAQEIKCLVDNSSL